MELDKMGDPDRPKTALIACMSDTDKSFSFLHAIMMWQTINLLCNRAAIDYHGKLPVPVNFIFDEFANIGTIPDIEQTIAVVRSRNIGITVILQSMAQLEARYDKNAKTIVDCCDTTLFLGGKSNETNREISEMIGKQTINLLSGYGWVAALLVVATVAGAGYAGKQYLDARKEKDGDADGGES